MNNYRLLIEDNYNKELELELLSSYSIYKLDRFTMEFDSEDELLKYFKVNKINNFFKVYIKDRLKSYPVMYSNYLNYIDNVEYLNKKLIEKSHDYNFLKYFLKNYNHIDGINDYLKLIKKSLNTIDKYSYNMIMFSVDKCDYDSIISNCLNFKGIKKGKNTLYKKELLLEHINYEYIKIENYLQEVFNRIVYNDKNINYMNLRNLSVFINNYQDNVTYGNDKKFVKRIKS